MKHIHKLLLLTLGASICIAADAQVLFQDEFNGSIDSAWTITRPDEAFYTINATELGLRCSSQDIDVGGNNNAKNLFTISNPLPSNADFTVTLKLSSFIPVSNDHAQICLVAMDDEDNLVRANYGFIIGGRAAEFGTEVAGNWSAQRTAVDFGSGAFFLRLSKKGRTYAQSYSYDGQTYTDVNSPTKFGSGHPARLGFVCGVDPSESSHAYIDSFTVEMNQTVGIRVATVQIFWPTVTGKNYQAQWASTLAPAVWNNLGEPVAGTGDYIYLTDTVLDGVQKNYRVVTVP